MYSDVNLLPLNELKAGQKGRIRRLEGLPSQIQRLREFGFRDGIPVEMVRPGKCCILRLGPARICYRPDQQTRIWVENSDTA